MNYRNSKRIFACFCVLFSILPAQAGEPSPAFLKGESFLKQGDFQRALTKAETAYRNAKITRLEYLKLKGAVYNGLENNTALAELCRDALTLYPKEGEFYYLRACTYKDTQNPKEALADLNKAIALSPNSAKAYLKRARILFVLTENLSGGDYLKQARADLKRSIELDGTQAEAFDYQGIWLSTEGKYQEAISSFSKAISLNNNDYRYFSHRASAYRTVNELEKALSDMDRLVVLRPNVSQGWITRAETLEQMKRYDDALASYERAVKLDQNKGDSRKARARLNLRIGKYKDAIVDLDFLVKLSPADDEHYWNRGLAWQGLKQYDRALKDFNTAIDFNPQLPSYYDSRAKLYSLRGEKSQAAQDKRRADKLRQERI